MLTSITQRLTYANVVSTLALFLAATGGVAWAVSLARNSVKSKHIAPGAVQSSDIKDHAVRLRDLADEVTGRGKDGANGLQGPKGDKGEKGDTGAPGAPGADATIQGRRMSETFTTLTTPVTIGESTSSPVATLGPLTMTLRCTKGSSWTGWTVIVTSSSATPTGLYGAVENDSQSIIGYRTVTSADPKPIIVGRASTGTQMPLGQSWAVTAVLPDGTIHDVRSIVQRNHTDKQCIFPATAMVERVSQVG
jgi:hypothetical protein